MRSLDTGAQQMRELTLNTSEFNAAVAKLMANSKRDAVAVLKEQARGILRNVITVTPPGKWGRSSSEARKKGRANVQADVFKVVQPVTRNPQVADVAALIKRHRRNGRIRKEVSPRITVPRDKLKEYLKKKQALVGFLASGWNHAAATLGVKPPAWVWNNEGPGSIAIEIGATSIRIVAINEVKYASGIGQLRSRLQWAVNQQQRAIERRLKRFQQEQAKKAGFKA